MLNHKFDEDWQREVDELTAERDALLAALREVAGAPHDFRECGVETLEVLGRLAKTARAAIARAEGQP